MTEQEKREKAVEDLESLANKACQAISDAYDACTDLCFPCRLLLGEFADYILRKEEEVRKETAKEIYKDVLSLQELMINNNDALCILRNVESWAKDAGVEVGE